LNSVAIDMNGDSDGRRSIVATINIRVIRNEDCPSFINLGSITPIIIDETFASQTLLTLSDHVQDDDPDVSLNL